MLKIAFVSPTFSPQMSGYAGMALPKAMAELGSAEVHVISANLNVYYYNPDYSRIYEQFLGPPVLRCCTEIQNGCTLHRLPHWKIRGHVYIRGLARLLSQLKPDVVQAWIPNGPIALQLALLKQFLGFRFFTGQHTTKSVFPLVNQSRIGMKDWLKVFCSRIVPGRLVSWASEGCYAATIDCGELAVRFMGVQKPKCLIRNLGVNTEMFHPASTPEELFERERMRHNLGFSRDDVVCCYTGRFTDDKNPLCLAKAIHQFCNEGRPFKGLFIGEGPQKSEIEACSGCITIPFLNYRELPPFYRLADIGVWPTQESTSMLDASASALPVVVSDRLVARERIEGNGLTYSQNDPGDMILVLASLESKDERRKLGDVGRKRMVQKFSWVAVAQRTLADFDLALAASQSYHKKNTRQVS